MVREYCVSFRFGLDQLEVVLGGDTPLGLPLILELEAQGYIVITSVCTPEAIHDIEQHTRGYVRAIVLDPSEVRLSDLFANLPLNVL